MPVKKAKNESERLVDLEKQVQDLTAQLEGMRKAMQGMVDVVNEAYKWNDNDSLNTLDDMAIAITANVDGVVRKK